jgi:hypothetical protein
MFTVTLHFFNKAGNRAKWTGDVAAVAGEDIFATASRVYKNRAKKGAATLIPGKSVAVRKVESAPAVNKIVVGMRQAVRHAKGKPVAVRETRMAA